MVVWVPLSQKAQAQMVLQVMVLPKFQDRKNSYLIQVLSKGDEETI